MKKENVLPLKNNDGCRLIFVLILNIISLMTTVIFFISITSSVRIISKVKHIENFRLVEFKYNSFKIRSGGAPNAGKMFNKYTFLGKLENENIDVTVTGWAMNKELRIFFKKFIAEKTAKVWYNPKYNLKRAYFQAEYPTKRSYLNYIISSLMSSFFVPLILLIRLLYLYGSSTMKLLKKQIKELQNMPRIILLLLLLPFGLNAQEEQSKYSAYPITLCAEIEHEGRFYYASVLSKPT